MSLISYGERNIGADVGRQADVQTGAQTAAHASLRFLPSELTAKCRSLLESYHALYGYAGLPDMLWHSDARDIIECHRDLTKVFKNGSKSRCAKRANDSFLLIASTIVALEILARDFAGWGRRYPAAKKNAELLIGDALMNSRNWLMDKYLYPPLGIHREFAAALLPSELTPAR
jgi:hypothetical protein